MWAARISIYSLFAAACFQALATESPDARDDLFDVAAVADDECLAQGGEESCALNALQLRAKQKAEEEAMTEAAMYIQREAQEEVLVASSTVTEEVIAEAEEAARALLSPRHRYNSSAFGGLQMPLTATQYDGIEDKREFTVEDDGQGYTHVFAIGDWGAVLPNHYTAPNKRGHGRKCPQNCGYVYGIDDKAQILVANVMKARAGSSNPQYVLNVGDNFYWAGIREQCTGTFATGKTIQSFSAGWQSVYGGLTSKPWLSCLGNHDYGGYQFNKGWPQQIGYSFVNRNWVMPARYFSRVMHHPGFSVEYFMIDSNAFDAKDPNDDPMHNICSAEHNPPGANCAAGGGPHSVNDCRSWFWGTYHAQKSWLVQKLQQSTADWQVVVTHFPCGHDAGFYRSLHQEHGLDLLVTGHRHDQELWAHSGSLGGMTCFVTGGGGGITSEHSPSGMGSSEYGFFDLTLSKSQIHIELIALNGATIRQTTVHPKSRR